MLRMSDLTSVTLPRETLADLHIAKAVMTKSDGRTVRLPEVVARIVAAWLEANR